MYKWLSLERINRWEPIAQEQGVSKVARSSRGFLRALEAHGQDDLPDWWKKRRQDFIKRHMAQVKKRNEPLMKNGMPTRRHLALIMWAYSPLATKI